MEEPPFPFCHRIHHLGGGEERCERERGEEREGQTNPGPTRPAAKA